MMMMMMMMMHIGKGRELADMMERRKVDILCVQETRWKGSKARSIGAGFKLFYYGVDSKRNGVGVVLKEEFVRNVLDVKRVSDRVMSLKLEIEGVLLNVVSGYAPQVGCELGEKERFWSELDEVMESIPTGERVVIGADFNGHVGEGNTGDEEVMGKFGVKERNLEGQMVVEFPKRMDMGVVNTYFQKREEHRVTYKSGGRRTQVDYILCRRGNLKEISDCKVVVGESVARQHRMVVCRMTLMVCKTKRSKIEKKTKWWKLKKEECCEEFRQKLRQAMGGQVVLPDDWETTAEVIRETGRKVLGVSSGRRKEDKETWWWNEEVQDSIQRKRLAKKKWDMDRTEENRQEYKELQHRVKREVSKAKQKAYDELYTRLDTREGEKDLYRLARQRDRDGKDVQQVRVIKDRDGRVLTSEESVQRRWKEYFEELMNEENEREKRVEGVNSVEQKVDKIRKDEVRNALKRMKSGKAVGPDDIPVEYRDGQRELHCVFVDLEKAYDRVPREELWYCMRKSGVAEKYVRVVQDMYERSRTVVRCAVGQTEEFKVEVGLHQGSALSPFLFAIVMDQLSEEVRQESPWTMMFADDIVICSESREKVEENLERWRFALERRGMKVSRSKTEYMCVNEREGSGTVRLQGEEVKKVQEFKYLGSTVQSSGECGKEVKKRVQAGWNGWRKVSGVLCDQKISARIKGKVYRTVVRPAMLYGLETVSLRKRQESELEVAELKMLSYTSHSRAPSVQSFQCDHWLYPWTESRRLVVLTDAVDGSVWTACDQETRKYNFFMAYSSHYQMSQTAQTVLKLDTAAAQGLKHGINFKKNNDGKCFIIYKNEDGIRACRNQCKHQGGLFLQDMEDMDGRTVRCSKHFWKLNMATMQYVNPPDSFTQDELEVVCCEDGGLEFVELDPPDPWTVDPRTAEELQPGEVMFNMAPHGKELSEDLKKRIVALHKDGLGYKKIAKSLKPSCSTVAKTIQQFNRTGSTQTTPCQGRPKQSSARAQCHIHRRKPLLKMMHKKARKQFAEDKQTKDMDYWNHVLWSDETKINLFGSDGVKRVWWQPGEEYKDKCVLPTVKHSGGSVMVPWGTMNANMYCDILKQSMIPSLWRLGHMAVFQHDNDPKLTSKATTALLKKLRLTYITHACVEVKVGSKRMMFDPWLVGPAFARGWWLLHEPPSDALERLYTADLVYISHMHSDHLSFSLPLHHYTLGTNQDLDITTEHCYTGCSILCLCFLSLTTRIRQRGGGTGLLLPWRWCSTPIPLSHLTISSFEFQVVSVTSPINLFIIVNYHPPGPIGDFMELPALFHLFLTMTPFPPYSWTLFSPLFPQPWTFSALCPLNAGRLLVLLLGCQMCCSTTGENYNQQRGSGRNLNLMKISPLTVCSCPNSKFKRLKLLYRILESSTTSLAEDFSTFYNKKIEKICQTFASAPTSSTLQSQDSATPSLRHLSTIAAEEVLQIIQSCNLTTCPLDPIPSTMLQTISPDLLPFITTVINGSIASGHVPTTFKKARVIPILKKPALVP
ncbi:hypothetical protein QTP86_011156 [Hemibagrus guttatus]|nr:hypothetical protein QTP86_011156 [Hemibagrus guttatus]